MSERRKTVLVVDPLGDTRERLAKYDPDLFELIDETFGKNPWRYVRYDKRNAVGGK